MITTDHLQLIAAITVECGCVKADMTLVCLDCKGSGRVLDPRFDKLRGQCETGVHGFKGEQGLVVTCQEIECVAPVRDLAVLLEIGVAVFPTYASFTFRWSHDREQWECDISGPDADDNWDSFSSAEAGTALEAAAEAFWNWLESEKQVKA